MPPRYAYWTILVDEQPTAFRAGSQEDLMPTFKRLKQKNPTAKMMWWQNGKLWDTRLDAQEAMRARGEIGRRNDTRQAGGLRDRDRDRTPRPERSPSGKLDWKPKGEGRPRSEWRPKSAALMPRDHLVRRSLPDGAKPAWKPKGESRPRSEWKPKLKSFGSEGVRRSAKPEAEWRPKTQGRAEWKPKGEGPRLEWRPKSNGSAAGGGESRRRVNPNSGSKPQGAPAAPKRAWVPKEQYKKSQGIEARRDKNWRPGGEHKDPRQKYKDAKKAKWSRFKQNIRAKWETKQTAPKKRRDKE